MMQFKTPLTYGLYGSLIGFMFFVVLLISGNSPWGNASWAGAWIPGLAVYFGVKIYRDNDMKGYVTYGQAFLACMVVVVAQAFVYEILTYIFSLATDSNAIEAYKQEVMMSVEATEEMMVSLVGEEMFEKAISEVENMSLSQVTISDFQSKIIGGVIVSLILAGVLTRKKPIFEEHE